MARNYNNGLDYITEADESRYDDEVFYESSYLTSRDEYVEIYIVGLDENDDEDDEDTAWWDDDSDWDLEVGFDPYEGTYTYDC